MIPANTTRPIHGGYPDAPVEPIHPCFLPPYPDVREEMTVEEVEIALLTQQLWQANQELSRLRSEITNLHSRSEHAAQNAEALQEQVNVLREACEKALPEIRSLFHQLTGYTIDRPKPGDRGVRRAVDALSAALAQCAPEEVMG